MACTQPSKLHVFIMDFIFPTGLFVLLQHLKQTWLQREPGAGSVHQDQPIEFLPQPPPVLATALGRPFVRLGQTMVSWFCRDGRKGSLLMLPLAVSL